MGGETARHPGNVEALHKANLQRMRQVKNASHLPNTLNIQNHIGPGDRGFSCGSLMAPDNILCPFFLLFVRTTYRIPLELDCKHTLPSFMLPAIAV